VIGHPACPYDPPAEFATERLLPEGAEEILPTAASALPLPGGLASRAGNCGMKSLNVQPRAFAGVVPRRAVHRGHTHSRKYKNTP
jgi:hypothetical protein